MNKSIILLCIQNAIENKKFLRYNLHLDIYIMVVYNILYII